MALNEHLGLRVTQFLIVYGGNMHNNEPLMSCASIRLKSPPVPTSRERSGQITGNALAVAVQVIVSCPSNYLQKSQLT